MTDRDTSAGIPARVRLGWLSGELSARPGEPTRPRPAPGEHRLGQAEHRPAPGENRLGEADGAPVLYVPDGLPDGPVALVVLLHGATSNPERALPYLREQARGYRFPLLVPKSRDRTWDVVRTGFGPDVAALDQLLAAVFEEIAVDPERVAIAGFSDGASYALSVGLINGDLFPRILAFSPGFVLPGQRRGRPEVFVSHGVHDQVLPVDQCGRRIVADLRRDGYSVDYREFDGGHQVVPRLACAAAEQLVSGIV